jgi:chromosome segregation ATPase
LAQSVQNPVLTVTPQTVEKISTDLNRVSKSLDDFNARFEMLLQSINKFNGVQLNENQQRLLFAYEVLNNTDQLAATLRKSIIDTGEREAAMRRRLKKVEFDLRENNMEKALAHLGTTKLDEERQQTRESLNEERSTIVDALNQIAEGKSRLASDLRTAENFAQDLRQTLFRQLREELDKLPDTGNRRK